MGLLIAVTCGIAAQLGPVKMYKQHIAEGLFVCADESSRQVQVTVPPVMGQFTAQTRDEIIDLFDFDGRPESKGAWFWKETIQKEPTYVVSVRDIQLPIILSTSSGTTGIQSAELQNVPPMTNLPVTYSCNGATYSHGAQTPTSYGNGVGSCMSINGAVQVIEARLPATSVTRLTGCINDVVESKDATVKTWKFDAKDCDLDIRITTLSGSSVGRIVYRAKERTGLMPKPAVVDGKVRWPFEAVANAEDNRGWYSWGAKGQFSWRKK